MIEKVDNIRSVADPGSTRGGSQLSKWDYFATFLPKTAWKRTNAGDLKFKKSLILLDVFINLMLVLPIRAFRKRSGSFHSKDGFYLITHRMLYVQHSARWLFHHRRPDTRRTNHQRRTLSWYQDKWDTHPACYQMESNNNCLWWKLCPCRNLVHILENRQWID